MGMRTLLRSLKISSKLQLWQQRPWLRNLRIVATRGRRQEIKERQAQDKREMVKITYTKDSKKKCVLQPQALLSFTYCG